MAFALPCCSVLFLVFTLFLLPAKRYTRADIMPNSKMKNTILIVHNAMESDMIPASKRLVDLAKQTRSEVCVPKQTAHSFMN